jgi:hypothetical protein
MVRQAFFMTGEKRPTIWRYQEIVQMTITHSKEICDHAVSSYTDTQPKTTPNDTRIHTATPNESINNTRLNTGRPYTTLVRIVYPQIVQQVPMLADNRRDCFTWYELGHAL